VFRPFQEATTDGSEPRRAARILGAGSAG
jgi:hypothetical protein